MKFRETKRIIFYLLVLVLCFIVPDLSNALDYSSPNFIVKDPIINSGTGSTSSTNFGLGQSLAQSAIGRSTSTSFELWSGFQYFFKASANSLNAAAGNGEVGLSWTVPQTFLGMTVFSYEVGVGTVSGSYTFTDRGNITNYTQTGLTNGTQYFFIIKAKGPGGVVLVFSNEVSSTPTAPTPPPPPSSGGGGGGVLPPPPSGGATITMSGLAYPRRSITVLKDGAVAASTTADPAAQFNVSISNLATGVHAFSLYATDLDGKNSPALSFFQSLTSGVTTEVRNLFLGPTLGVSHSTIKQGENINIFGFTAPDSEVTIFTNSSHQHMDQVAADESGGFFMAFNTAVLEFGEHSTYAQSAKDNKLSPYSTAVDFQVSTESIETSTESGPKSPDINGDNRVNLVDFSILLFYWQKPNSGADLDGSGIVDLTDFSILLFNWTG